MGLDVTSDLRDMCCPAAQFMWDNHLLSPRVETSYGASTTPLLIHVLKGLRVRRAFLGFRRDQRLYECPFCAADWVVGLGYTDALSGVEQTLSQIRFPARYFSHAPDVLPRSVLLTALADTKRRNRTWPPVD